MDAALISDLIIEGVAAYLRNDGNQNRKNHLNSITVYFQLRLKMIQYLANFQPQNLGDLLIGSQTLQAATGVVKEITVEAQVREMSQNV